MAALLVPSAMRQRPAASRHIDARHVRGHALPAAVHAGDAHLMRAGGEVHQERLAAVGFAAEDKGGIPRAFGGPAVFRSPRGVRCPKSVLGK